jgi:hypothetical protein
MERYKNLSGTSGVSAYQIAADSITVRFTDGAAYIYTYASAGANAIEDMKKLAAQGSGLNAYINTNVRRKYLRKLP